jgi:hypothetical protein
LHDGLGLDDPLSGAVFIETAALGVLQSQKKLQSKNGL